MKPVLYRYRDSESVIKAMDGYTPGEGWTPLYDQAAVDAAVAAEREELLAALKDIAVGHTLVGAWRISGAAITKAEGEST